MKKFKQYLSLNYIFLVGVLILPLVFWPKAPVPYEIPRVWFFNRWVELMVVIALIEFQFNKEFRNSKLVYFVFIYFFVLLISSILGIDLYKSMIGNYYRGDGLITLVHLIAFSLIAFLFLNKKIFKKAPFFLFVGSILVSLLAIIDNFKLYVLQDFSVVNFYGVIGSTFGQPNFLAGYLLVTLPFGFYIFKLYGSKYKAVILSLIAVQTLVIFFTRSWGALLGLTMFILLWILFFVKKHRKILALSFSVIFIFISIFFIINQRNIVESLPNKFIAESRVRIFTKGFLGFMQRPIFGWGWANFDYAFESVDWPVHFETDIYVDKAHSHFLEVLVATGAGGLIIYLTLLFLTIKTLIIRKDFLSKTYLITFLVFIFHSQTNVISISEEIIFWLILGYAITPIVSKKPL